MRPVGSQQFRELLSACGLQRVNYFAGQLLSAKDFVDEQDYFRARLRRRNRLLHGAGIVSGLAISVPPGNGSQGWSVVVEPGLALDPRGEEIEVCKETAAPLPMQGKPLLVQLLFTERPTAPLPALVPAGAAPDSEQQFSRIEETFTVVLAPLAQADTISIGRLKFSRGRWRVDRRFKPPRARK
jgi:hypothetical protein